MKKTIITLFTLTALFVGKTYGQSTREKADAMAAEFNKEKNKEKEKNGVATEKHKVVEAKPDIRDNIASYAGNYELNGLGDRIIFRYSNNNWEADYMQLLDNKEVKKAILKDIKIESALLTATIQYADGKSVPVEGVFINRFKNGEKIPGLGVRKVSDLSNGFIMDKAFYKRVE